MGNIQIHYPTEITKNTLSITSSIKYPLNLPSIESELMIIVRDPNYSDINYSEIYYRIISQGIIVITLIVDSIQHLEYDYNILINNLKKDIILNYKKNLSISNVYLLIHGISFEQFFYYNYFNNNYNYFNNNKTQNIKIKNNISNMTNYTTTTNNEKKEMKLSDKIKYSDLDLMQKQKINLSVREYIKNLSINKNSNIKFTNNINVTPRGNIFLDRFNNILIINPLNNGNKLIKSISSSVLKKCLDINNINIVKTNNYKNENLTETMINMLCSSDKVIAINSDYVIDNKINNNENIDSINKFVEGIMELLN